MLSIYFFGLFEALTKVRYVFTQLETLYVLWGWGDGKRSDLFLKISYA
jgi:hypothetical protein